MADTWRENAIVEAIEIIADKKIAQAGYDKTIKGVINQVLDKTTGKYEIKYQDSLFEAYATNANINYLKNDVVSVLIPGNDWDRTKTILSGVSNYATTYQQVPVASLQYNQIGTNGVNLSQNILLSSYAGLSIVIDSSHTTYGSLLDITNYIKKGDSIALSMVVRTALASSQQVNGIYGLTFNLKFADTTTTDDNDYIVRSFTVDTSDVIGNPYLLISDTLVETLITGVDTLNFIGIDSIEAFCTNFPEDESKVDIKDIIISSIGINGAAVLTEEDLSGYVLHLNYSKNGNILPQTGEPSLLEVIALLKVNGKIISSDVKYYWFRLNGNIFRGDDRYSGFAGDGWECLNYFVNKTPVELTTPSYFFNRAADDFANSKALANQRTNKILCVAVYKNEWIKGKTLIINMAARKILIVSSDLIDGKNKTEYFLNNGSPSLICKVDDSLIESYEYIWSFKPSKGKALKIIPSSTAEIDPYAVALEAYLNQLDIVSKMAEDSATIYKETDAYTTPVNNWNNNFKDKEYIYKNKYYNFPIKKISDLAVISCAVYNGLDYVGTGNIVLYNKQVLEGTYSLNILNGVQIFQYDEKGNSPFVSLIDRKAILGTGPASLGFTLLDNTGQLISYEQIINNGYVRWLFPGYDTLLISNLGNPDIAYNDPVAKAADKALAANLYNIYENRKIFSYSIVDQYKLSSINNTIRLVVKYDDIVIESYTDFTFPKNGDPGTNGTDLVAKLTPSNSTSLINSDRVYGHRINNSNQGFYTDSGSSVDRFKFFVYNNNRQVYDTASFWSCPPKTTSSDKNKTDNNFITVNSSTGVLTLGTSSSTSWSDINTKKPIHIVRGKKTVTDGSYFVDYMAEYPVCYVYTNEDYRIKIKPKTGFKYVVYQEDGTRPDYDNQPFELIVEKRLVVSGTAVWTTSGIENISAVWSSISGIKNIIPLQDKTYIATVIPSLTFDGLDLTCAIIAEVSVDGDYIGFIHIPIYKLINKYGHNALNGWDGNSIQLNANGDTILAPQVGAGKKLSNNTFTGILMGDVKTDSTTDTGLFGYDKGVRSIFLDAKTGKTVLGKNGAGQITIDPRNDSARIYSGNYNYSPGTTAGAGMEIDLTDPHIKFGSGHFEVDNAGNITAKGGGTIAGWKISDTRLTSPNNNVYLSSNANDSYAIYSNGTFTVSPGGYMTSTSGKIAKWNIDANALTDGNVGMGLGKTIAANTFNNQSSAVTDARIWSGTGTGNGAVTFAVTSGGKLYSKSAQIGPWSINNDQFTNQNVGLGTKSFSSNNPFTSGTIAARFWAASGSSDSNLNFAVDNVGNLYSKAGKIGGWNIGDSSLYAVSNTSGTTGIRLNSNGSMNGGSGYNSNTGTGGSWAINTDGSSSFTNITANRMTATNVDATDIVTHNLTANDRGTIGGWTIGNSTLTGGQMIINSNGSMSGPGWSIDSNGNAKFANSGGSFSAGGGSSNVGGFSCGAAGGGSWGGPTGTMLAKKIKIFTNLVLKRVSAGATPLGVFYCFGRNKALSECVDIKQSGTTPVQGTISGTVDGHSISGTCTVNVPKYVIDIKNDYRLVLDVSQIGTNIVTGWSKTDTILPSFLCSADPNQSADAD